MPKYPSQKAKRTQKASSIKPAEPKPARRGVARDSKEPQDLCWSQGVYVLLQKIAFCNGTTFGRGPADDNGGVFGRGPADDNGGVFGRGPADDNGGVFGRDPADDNGGVFSRGPADDNGGASSSGALATFGRRLPTDFAGRPSGLPLFNIGSSRLAPRLDGGWSRLFRGLGYVPDTPDSRDYSIADLAHRQNAPHCDRFCQPKPAVTAQIVQEHDLSSQGGFGPVDHQGPTQSCTAHAVTSMVEYRLSDAATQLSRLFIYKAARTIGQVRGDEGARLRDCLKGIRRYGCLTEDEWPFRLDFLNAEPTLADLNVAERYSGLSYSRLDDYNITGEETLDRVLCSLLDGFPVAFGFMLFASAESFSRKSGFFPPPKKRENAIGGHAVLAVGYDRKKIVPGSDNDEIGALKIRNSWGEQWGEAGYGWIPFSYVRKQIACDFWASY